MPPTFENPETETVSPVAGSTLVLSCDVTGVPAPTVTWLKDRRPVGESLSPYHFAAKYFFIWDSPGTSAVKKLPANAGDTG